MFLMQHWVRDVLVQQETLLSPLVQLVDAFPLLSPGESVYWPPSAMAGACHRCSPVLADAFQLLLRTGALLRVS
jgi:hypothetical protein